MYTVNDYKILSKFVKKNNEEDTKGLVSVNGFKISELAEISDLSVAKVRKTIKLFIEDELVSHGAKQGNSKSFIITQKGIKRLQEITGYQPE